MSDTKVEQDRGQRSTEPSVGAAFDRGALNRSILWLNSFSPEGTKVYEFTEFSRILIALSSCSFCCYQMFVGKF